MGFNIQGLGAAAGGFAEGMERGQRMKMREQDQNWQNEERGRSRKKWKKEDDDLALDESANAEARKVIQEDIAAHNGVQMPQGMEPQGVPGLAQAAPMAAPAAPPMGAGDGPVPAGPAMGAAPEPMAAPQGLGAAQPMPQPGGLASAQPAGPQPTPQQPKPYQPSPATVLRAARARTDAYFAAGRVDKGMSMWAQDEGMRYRVRAGIAPSVKAAVASGGDITAPLKAFYDTMDDGNDIASVKPSSGLDGKQGYTIETVNRATGKKESRDMSAEQIVGTIDAVMADPKEAAKTAMEMKLKAFEGDQHRQTEVVKGGQQRQTEGDKHKGDMEEIGLRNAGNLAVAGKRGETAVEVANVRGEFALDGIQARGAAGGGKGGADSGGKIQSTYVDSEGYKVGVFRNGEQKRLTLDGQPVRASEWGKRVDSMAKELGKGLGGMSKKPEELRQEAERTLLSGKPAVEQPKGLPEGSKQIGTSGGKPVYQGPDGKRFIQE